MKRALTIIMLMLALNNLAGHRVQIIQSSNSEFLIPHTPVTVS